MKFTAATIVSALYLASAPLEASGKLSKFDFVGGGTNWELGCESSAVAGWVRGVMGTGTLTVVH
jgi:hypothetical protein